MILNIYESNHFLTPESLTADSALQAWRYRMKASQIPNISQDQTVMPETNISQQIKSRILVDLWTQNQGQMESPDISFGWEDAAMRRKMLSLSDNQNKLKCVSFLNVFIWRSLTSYLSIHVCLITAQHWERGSVSVCHTLSDKFQYTESDTSPVCVCHWPYTHALIKQFRLFVRTLNGPMQSSQPVV